MQDTPESLRILESGRQETKRIASVEALAPQPPLLTYLNWRVMDQVVGCVYDMKPGRIESGLAMRKRVDLIQVLSGFSEKDML
jgi:hypothetical protein